MTHAKKWLHFTSQWSLVKWSVSRSFWDREDDQEKVAAFHKTTGPLYILEQ